MDDYQNYRKLENAPLEVEIQMYEQEFDWRKQLREGGFSTWRRNPVRRKRAMKGRGGDEEAKTKKAKPAPAPVSDDDSDIFDDEDSADSEYFELI